MKYWVGAGSFAFMLMVSGCGTQDMATQEPAEEAIQEEAAETDTVEKTESTDAASGDEHEAEPEIIDPYDYFMEDGSTAHFEGVGNEFAQYSLRTDYMEANHVATYEDNGGTVMLRVYRLHDDRIELVKEQGEFYEDYNADFDELQALEVISTYLEFPIEEGQSIGESTVSETGASLETPYRNFDDVFTLEQEEAGSITRRYFAEGFGEVKREFLANPDDPDEMAVTSTLSSIEFAEEVK